MLKVHVKYHLKPGTQADFLAGVTEKTLQDAVLNEDGCLKYDYSPWPTTPTRSCWRRSGPVSRPSRST